MFLSKLCNSIVCELLLYRFQLNSTKQKKHTYILMFLAEENKNGIKTHTQIYVTTTKRSGIDFAFVILFLYMFGFI